MTAAQLETPEDSEIAYLGPEGSFSHMVAQERFPKNRLVPFRSVPEVFEFIQGNASGKGFGRIE